MTLSDSAVLAAVELPIYLILLPVVVYLAYMHGRHGLLGWFYINISCVVRVAADVVEIVQGSHSGNDANKPTLAATIIGSIGLSPLILALAGLAHELHYHLVFGANSYTIATKTNRRMWSAQAQIHGVTIAGMVLLIVGGVHLATATTASDISGDEKLRYGGAILLLVVWLGIVQYSAWLLYRCHQSRATLRQDMLELAKWTLVAGLIVGIRMIYAVVYTFDHSDSAINPITGSLAVKVVLTVAVTLAAVLAMVFGGWKSRHIGKNYGRLTTERSEEEESGHLMVHRMTPVVK